MQVEYDEFNSLSVLGTGGDPLVIPLPNADLPLQVFNFAYLQYYMYIIILTTTNIFILISYFNVLFTADHALTMFFLYRFSCPLQELLPLTLRRIKTKWHLGMEKREWYLSKLNTWSSRLYTSNSCSCSSVEFSY